MTESIRSNQPKEAKVTCFLLEKQILREKEQKKDKTVIKERSNREGNIKWKREREWERESERVREKVRERAQ